MLQNGSCQNKKNNKRGTQNAKPSQQ